MDYSHSLNFWIDNLVSIAGWVTTGALVLPVVLAAIWALLGLLWAIITGK